MICIGSSEVEQREFGDHALKIFLPPDIDTDLITWLYHDDAELFTLMCIKLHYHDKEFNLYMPYCPHARQDRVKNPEDVFTLKYFCEIINSLNFKSVIIEDPHSNVCTALLNNVVVVQPFAHVNEVIRRINDDGLVLFYPDAGAMKRYENAFDLPFAYGEKRRNWETGRVESLEIAGADIVKNNNVLIVDDICSYGGTFARAAKALKEAGANAVYLYITHCEDNIHKGSIFDEGNIEKVFTTNSIYTSIENYDKVVVL